MDQNESLPVDVVNSIQVQFDRVELIPGQDIRSVLSEAVNRMIIDDFSQLMNILYRLDVSEEKIRTAVSLITEQPASDLIADLIIRRELEKYNSRKSFNSNVDIDDEEKW